MPNLELRFYPAEQVLDWWRSYSFAPRLAEVERSVGRIGPEGYPERTMKADPVAGEIHIDRRYLAYLHVELFFERNFEWHHCRAHLLKGDPSAVDEVWERWYKANPMMITADAVRATGTVKCPELVSMPLSEALEIYNSSAKRSKRRTLRAAQEAAKTRRLFAWEPGGRYVTTVNEIRIWVESDSRKSQDSGNSAA